MEDNNYKKSASSSHEYFGNFNSQSSTSQKRAEAGRKGGKAPHSCRGLACSDEQTRKRVASEGGKARGGSRRTSSENE